MEVSTRCLMHKLNNRRRILDKVASAMQELHSSSNKLTARVEPSEERQHNPRGLIL